MIKKAPSYMKKMPIGDHPFVLGELPYLIEKILYMDGVTARHQGICNEFYDHILIETTSVDKTTGRKTKKVLFEFIEECDEQHGCIYTGDNKLIYAGDLCSENWSESLFNQVYFMAEANSSDYIYAEANSQQQVCPDLKPVFNYVLPILRSRSK